MFGLLGLLRVGDSSNPITRNCSDDDDTVWVNATPTFYERLSKTGTPIWCLLLSPKHGRPTGRDYVCDRQEQDRIDFAVEDHADNGDQDTIWISGCSPLWCNQYVTYRIMIPPTCRPLLEEAESGGSLSSWHAASNSGQY